MFRLKNIIIGIIISALLGMVMLLGACQGALSTDNSSEAAVPISTRPQQQIQEEKLAMRYYYDTYHDEYAALVLREMYEAGEITQEDYSGDYAAAGDALSSADIKEYKKINGMLNCQLSRLSQKDLLKCRLILTEKMKGSPMLISIFNLPQQRDEVEKAVEVIDKWAASPGDSNTKMLEDELISERLSCGARVYLYYYLSGISGNIGTVELDGKKYDPAYYLDSRVSEWFNDALSEIMMQNYQHKSTAASETADQ